MLELLFSLNNTKVQENERNFDSDFTEQYNIYSRRTHIMEKYICTYTGQQNFVLPLLLHVLRGMCGWVDGWMGVGVWVCGNVGVLNATDLLALQCVLQCVVLCCSVL